jgi:hypothetical protein
VLAKIEELTDRVTKNGDQQLSNVPLNWKFTKAVMAVNVYEREFTRVVKRTKGVSGEEAGAAIGELLALVGDYNFTTDKEMCRENSADTLALGVSTLIRDLRLLCAQA